PPAYDPYPGAAQDEDPGSSLDPTFLDYKATLGEEPEPYDGDPSLLDYPDLYPPELVGTGPSVGLFTSEDAKAQIPDCKIFPRTGLSVAAVSIYKSNSRYLSYRGKSSVFVGWSADAACHFKFNNPDNCNAGTDATAQNAAVPANYPAVLAALRLGRTRPAQASQAAALGLARRREPARQRAFPSGRKPGGRRLLAARPEQPELLRSPARRRQPGPQARPVRRGHLFRAVPSQADLQFRPLVVHRQQGQGTEGRRHARAGRFQPGSVPRDPRPPDQQRRRLPQRTDAGIPEERHPVDDQRALVLREPLVRDRQRARGPDGRSRGRRRVAEGDDRSGPDRRGELPQGRHSPHPLASAEPLDCGAALDGAWSGQGLSRPTDFDRQQPLHDGIHRSAANVAQPDSPPAQPRRDHSRAHLRAQGTNPRLQRDEDHAARRHRGRPQPPERRAPDLLAHRQRSRRSLGVSAHPGRDLRPLELQLESRSRQSDHRADPNPAPEPPDLLRQTASRQLERDDA